MTGCSERNCRCSCKGCLAARGYGTAREAHCWKHKNGCHRGCSCYDDRHKA